MINFYKLSYFQKREYDIRALRRLVKDGLLLPSSPATKYRKYPMFSEYDCSDMQERIKANQLNDEHTVRRLTERRQATNAEAKEFFSKIKYKGA